MHKRYFYKLFRKNIYSILIIASIYLIILKFIYPNSINGVFHKIWKRSNNKEIKDFSMAFKDLNVSYQFFVNKNFKCDEYQILIIIPSRPNGFDNRMGIRNSWLKNLPSNVFYQFIIGSTKNQSIKESINKEDEQFHDIILSTLHESYSNLTLKTYSIFQWKEHFCPKIKYLLKTDDDTVIDIRRLQYWINKNFNRIGNMFAEKVIFCKVWTNAAPFRDPEHKWYIPEYAFNGTVFPNFCSGPTYLLTAKSIPAILKEAPNHHFIVTEDVFFTGIVSEAAEVFRFNKDKNFASGPEIGNATRCDRKNVPFLSTLFGIGFNGTIYDEINNNPFKNATDQLLSLPCGTHNYFI